MNSMESFKDVVSLNVFGRSRILAIAGAQCVSCGRSATEFRDKVSHKEYSISGLCQKCQDRFFDDPMEDPV